MQGVSGTDTSVMSAETAEIQFKEVVDLGLEEQVDKAADSEKRAKRDAC